MYRWIAVAFYLCHLSVRARAQNEQGSHVLVITRAHSQVLNMQHPLDNQSAREDWCMLPSTTCISQNRLRLLFHWNSFFVVVAHSHSLLTPFVQRLLLLNSIFILQRPFTYDSIHCIQCGVQCHSFSGFPLCAVQLLANHFATHLLIYSQTMSALETKRVVADEECQK